MLDVRSLDTSLELFPDNPAAALREYARRRLPENRALMRLAQVHPRSLEMLWRADHVKQAPARLALLLHQHKCSVTAPCAASTTLWHGHTARLLQIGVPSQHAARRFWLQRRVLAANYAWRIKLSKVVPALISPPAARMLSAPKRSVRQHRLERLYQEALQAANKTSAVLWGALVALLAAMFAGLQSCAVW